MLSYDSYFVYFILNKIKHAENIERIIFFGSAARGEADKESDIDILIEPPKGMGLAFIRLKRDLEQSLGKKVDLVSFRGISPYLKDSILKYQKRIV